MWFLHLLARCPLNLQPHPASFPDTHGYLIQGTIPYTWPKRNGELELLHINGAISPYLWMVFGPTSYPNWQKTSSQPFRANLAHGWRARRARVLGELHSHRVVSLFGGDRFKHGIPGKPQGFVKLQWSIEDNPNSSKLSIGDHVQMAVWHWLWVMSYGQYQISLII